MKIKNLILLVFFLNTIYFFAQVNESKKKDELKVLLKTDARAILLQPGISIEYFFIKKLSIDVGASYLWSGQKIYADQLGDRFGYTLLGIGPSRGHQLYSDLKFNFRNGVYIGLGYFYRYSYYKNKPFINELSQDNYQNYRQSEDAYSNMIRFTWGGHYNIKNNVYANPYVALMIGNSNIQVDIDTTSAKSYVNYKPTIFPEHQKVNKLTCFFEFGFKLCLGINSKNRSVKK